MPNKKVNPKSVTGDGFEKKPEKYLVTATAGNPNTAVIYAISEEDAKKKWSKRFGLPAASAKAENVSAKVAAK